MAKEYIERDALLKSIKNSKAVREVKFLAEVLVRTEPAADVVEVVRCRDCWKNADGLCGYRLKDVPGKDFCGAGERRDSDG